MRRYPTFVPYQLGLARLPNYDWEGSPSWNSVSTARRLPGNDFGVEDSIWRSPTEFGNLTFSGRYSDLKTRQIDYEIKIIDNYIGSWQPLIGYRDDRDCGCETTCGCPNKASGIRWLWTWARLDSADANGSLDSIMKEPEPFSFKMTLKEPLREVTHHWWRWGSEASVASNLTPREVEVLRGLEPNTFFPPIEVPLPNSPARWYFRDWRKYFLDDTSLLTIANRFGSYAWPGKIYSIRNGTIVLNVEGSYEPLFYIRCIYTGSGSVYNDVNGITRFSINANMVYDGESGFAWSSETPKLDSIPFRLAAGPNRIEFDGDIQIGIIPRWLR